MAMAARVIPSVQKVSVVDITTPWDNLTFKMIMEAIYFSKREHKISLLFFSIMFIVGVAHADPSFTEVLYGQSFSGAWETLSKFTWLGKILSWIISVFSFFGLVSSFSQMMVDYVYLSSKNQFDTVYDYQTEDAGSGIFGLSGVVKNTYSGKRGVGLNAIMGLWYSILPDAKTASSYNPERRAPGLDDDDTILSYTLKTFVPRLMLVLFFVLSFNGTIAKGFAMFAEAGAVAIDHAVSVDLAGQVDKWAQRGQGHTFTLGSSGTPETEMAERLAKKMYSMTISKAGVETTEGRNAVGNAIESWVFKNILANTTDQSAQLARYNLTVPRPTGAAELKSTDVDNLKMEVVINTTKELSTGEVLKGINPNESLALDLSTFLGSAGVQSDIKYYMHIFLIKGKTVDTGFFLTPTTRDQSGGSDAPQTM